VRDAFVELGPQRLRLPRRRQPGPQLTQDRAAVRTESEQVRQTPERVHDGLERVGGTELVEQLRRRRRCRLGGARRQSSGDARL